MPRKLTTELFIIRSNNIHNERYDYSETKYTKIVDFINIKCHKHGLFQIKASEHLRGIGCESCEFKSSGVKNRLNTNRFIEKANNIHGNRYSYESVKFCGYRYKVSITCKVHGRFIQEAGGHLQGQGCPSCSRGDRIDHAKGFSGFISKATVIHGSTYEYSKSIYLGTHKKLLITCPDHGDFLQTPAKHLSGQGCSYCADSRGGQRNRSTLSEFIRKSNIIHNNAFDYNLVEYITCRTPVIITCKIHGDFKQTPSRHLTGRACPSCSKSGYNPKKSGVLYILRCGDITKVGITNLQASKRASAISKSYGAEFQVVKEYNFRCGYLADKIETLLLRNLRKAYNQPSKKFQGYSECFYNVDLPEIIQQIETLTGELSGN
jgi:hypothetical protein